jgi:hypothetical protein
MESFYELQRKFWLQRTPFAIFCFNMQCILSDPLLNEGQILIYTHSLSVRCVVMVTVLISVDMEAQLLFIVS